MANFHPDAKKPPWSWQVRLLHWLTVLLILPQTVIALLFMGRGTGSYEWLSLHLSVGIVLFAILLARLGLRMITRSVRKSGIAAGVLQFLLYANVLAVSITGWLSYRPAAFAPRSPLFGVASLPRLRWLPELPWQAMHRLLVWILVFLIALHLGAVAYHSLIKKDGTMAAMLTGVPRSHGPAQARRSCTTSRPASASKRRK
ncbi:MAG: cytochrome b/b6 domain-containing protein [Devosia sp.]|nr:cytochrome b/b6 domain-containing protein [Devosia sp.]